MDKWKLLRIESRGIENDGIGLSGNQ